MIIQSVGRGRQDKLKGNVVNVPVSVDEMVQILPRTISETKVIQVKLRQRMQYKNPYIFESIRPKKIYMAAKYLISQHLYKSKGITLSTHWNCPNKFKSEINEKNIENAEKVYHNISNNSLIDSNSSKIKFIHKNDKTSNDKLDPRNELNLSDKSESEFNSNNESGNETCSSYDDESEESNLSCVEIDSKNKIDSNNETDSYEEIDSNEEKDINNLEDLNDFNDDLENREDNSLWKEEIDREDSNETYLESNDFNNKCLKFAPAEKNKPIGLLYDSDAEEL
jgi:hypothetical protein